MAAADARTGAEFQRLNEARDARVLWRKWGPYLSERQWGTVREDYSESGDAWNHFSHDQARSRAYRWGEDGLAGISDDRQLLCFALALWNGRDPITMHFFATTTAGQVIEAGKAAVGAAERRKTPARARVPAADRPRTPSVAG
jgi:hypothetical protein